MPLPDPSLEPAVRDPRKLRNTAITLVVIMIFGGCLIMLAYNKWAKQKATDDRPAVVYRITPERDLRMLRQDGSVADLIHLRKRVVAVNVISLRDPAAADLSMAVMKRLAETRATNPDFNLVTLVVDPMPREQLEKALAETAKAKGIALPQWWLGSNVPEDLHKFIYNQLKVSVYPHEENGKWLYDSSIVLIDKNGHIRRAVVPQKRGGQPYVATFDFEQAAGWDAKGVKTGTDKNNVQQLEQLLDQTIDKLLEEPFKES